MQKNSTLSRNTYLQFTILFLIIILFVFSAYFFTGSTLIWNADGITQHYPALLSWRETLRQLIFNHTLPAQWSWQIGLGADYLQTFSYYTIGDIFTYPVAFLSVSAVPIFYSLMIIVRLYLAGISFIWASTKLGTFSPLAKSLGAVSYTFFGYTAFAAFEHPFFLNPLVILPILIVAVNRAVTKQRYSLLVLMTAWTLFNNFYFAFMLTIAALVYWAVLWIQNPAFRSVKRFFKLAVAVLWGLALSAWLFLPGIVSLANSARSGKSIANGLLLYPLSYYLALPGTLIGNLATPTFWFTGGFSILSIFALIVVFNHHRFDGHKRQLLVLLLVAMFIFPIFAAIMNGGSSPSNRWSFLLNFPLGLALSYLIDHRQIIDRRDIRYSIIFSLIACLSLLYISKFSLQSSFGLVIALLIISIMTLRNQQRWYHLMTFLVVINAILTMNLNHQDNSDPSQSKMVTKAAVNQLTKQQANYTNYQTNQRSYVANPLNDVNGISPASNLASLSAIQNIESYWSLQNGSLGLLMNQLGVANSNPNDVVSNANLDSNLLNILGVNQVYLNSDHKLANFSSDNLAPVNRQTRQVSETAYPLFYETKHQISTKAFNALDSTTKAATMADTTVLNSPIKADQSSFAKTLTTAKISYNDQVHYQSTSEIGWSSEPTLLPNGIFLKKNSKLAGTNLQLVISNLEGTPFGFSGRFKTALATNQFNAALTKANPSQPTSYRNNQSAYTWNWVKNNLTNLDTQISGYTLTADYLGTSAKFTQTGKNNLSFYNPRTTIVLNLGAARNYQKDQFIPLSFDKPGNYRFTAKIVATPIDHRFRTVATAAQASKPKFKISKDRIMITLKNATDHERVLASSIPFSAGWRSDDASIIKVNNAFIGLKIPAHQRTVVITYHTPYLIFGMFVSGIATLGAVCYLCIKKFKHK